MTGAAIVADIGGTNARFALVEESALGPIVRDVTRYRAKEFATIEDAARAFLDQEGVRPARACFAVAAPLSGDQVRFTNSPWEFGVESLKHALALDEFSVVNDFHALAAGAVNLPTDGWCQVKDGEGDPFAPRLVIGPGTGLGQAYVVETNGVLHIVTTEGGHVAFAPSNDKQIEILRYLTQDLGRVTIEHVISGQGIVNIYRALQAIDGDEKEIPSPDEITRTAIDQSNPMAVEAVSLFCEFLGRAAGDAVLSVGARGGVFIGGGIVPKIKDFFLSSRFIGAFCDKGDMCDYVAPVPVKLIVEEHTALIGSAHLLQHTIR
ncbi:MAG: glucokinase [Pseudomonadota bacterium]